MRFILAYLKSEEAVETAIILGDWEIGVSILVLLQVSYLTFDKSLYFSKFWSSGFSVIQLDI